jgi:hypothetical protein
MNAKTSENDTPVQRSRSSTALGKRPVDDPPHSDISKPADPDNDDKKTDERARNAAEMQNLCYDPLEGPNIRLITVDPALQDGKLKLAMEQVPLTDGLDFHVLSYVWGDETEKHAIVVNGQRLDVTQNLYDFLETTRQYEPNFLSHHEHPHYKTIYNTGNARTVAGSSRGKVTGPATMPMRFWVDAICINQNDLNERNKQVPRMGDIYSMASRVWIWIGLPSKVFSEDCDLEVFKRGLDYCVQDSFKHLATLKTTRPPNTPLIEQFADHQRQLAMERMMAKMRAMGFVLDPGPMMDTTDQRYTQLSGLFSSQHMHAPFNMFLGQLASLLSQPYLKRVWIIQEYVLNPRAPIALLGNLVLNLQHVMATMMRLSREVQSKNEHSKALVFAAVGQMANLMT